jgi:hypothetical protein
MPTPEALQGDFGQPKAGVLFPPESPRPDQQEQQYCALLRVGLVGTGYLLGHSLDALVRGLVHIIMVNPIYQIYITSTRNHKNGFFTMTRDGDSPADHGVLPPPETVESGSIRDALPVTGEFSAERRTTMSPRMWVMALSRRRTPMNDEARVREMARNMGGHDHGRGERAHERRHHGDRSRVGARARLPQTRQARLNLERMRRRNELKECVKPLIQEHLK